MLGFDLSDCVNEALGIVFLRFSKTRGLGGVDLATSDAHMCLKRSIATAFQGAARQRFRRHFMRNVLTTCRGSQESVVSLVRTAFSLPAAQQVQQQYPEGHQVVRLLAPQGLGMFRVPAGACWFSPSSCHVTGVLVARGKWPVAASMQPVDSLGMVMRAARRRPDKTHESRVPVDRTSHGPADLRTFPADCWARPISVLPDRPAAPVLARYSNESQ